MNKMEKVICADWGTSDGDEAPPIATNRNENGIEPDQEESTSSHGSQLKKSTVTESNQDSNKRPNNLGVGGSQPRQNNDNSPSTDTSTKKTNDTVQSQYVNKLQAGRNRDSEINNNKKQSNERLNAVINALRERQLDKSIKRKQDIQETTQKIECHRTNEDQPPIRKIKPIQNEFEIMPVKVKHIEKLGKIFYHWFKKNKNRKVKRQNKRSPLRAVCYQSENILKERSAEEISNPRSDESMDRSEDNVLISNKYKTVDSVSNNDQFHNNFQDEWVPIGGGTTLIHKDNYSKINWKSYTVATRNLLLAAFPRNVLATHSLTGKRSPAFQDKPAKMRLDQRIIADILLEITSKFKVKANLVRSIITTKCADEAKMLRTRMAKKNGTKRSPHPSSDEENVPLETLKNIKNGLG